MSLITFHKDATKEKKRVKRISLYEGSTKTLFDDPCEDTVVLHFKDTLSKKSILSQSKISNIFHQQKKTIHGKGIINNRLSEMFFKGLQELSIENHFIRRLNMRESAFQACSPLPFKVIFHNAADDDFENRFDHPKGEKLPTPLLEFIKPSKSGAFHIMSERHLLSLGLTSELDLDKINEISQRVNDFLYGQLLAVGLRLINVTLEFGHHFADDFFNEPDILLIDEITPETMTLQDIKTKKFFNCFDKSDEISVYEDIAKRFNLICS